VIGSGQKVTRAFSEISSRLAKWCVLKAGPDQWVQVPPG
jgi:hypothetical protein